MSDALPPNGTISEGAARIAALRMVSGPEIVDQGIQLDRQNYEALLMAALVPLLVTVAIPRASWGRRRED